MMMGIIILTDTNQDRILSLLVIGITLLSGSLVWFNMRGHYNDNDITSVLE